MSCSALALAAGEALAGTATVASRWLLLEVGGAWGRDAVADTRLADPVRERLQQWLSEEESSRVLFIRRPERRGPQATVFLARSEEGGGVLRRLTLPSLAALPEADLDAGDPIAGTLIVVCVHGRRDPCCARHGVPVFEALSPHVADGLLWQSSHQGGHRFAANVLALPSGISLGRVTPQTAAAVAAELDADRVPVAHFRGRTIHPPAAQAAEAAVRRRLGLSGLGDVQVVESTPERIVLQTPAGALEATVVPSEGPVRPESCGADPTSATAFDVSW